MSFPQITTADGRVELKVGERRATLLMDRARIAAFDVKHEDTLSAVAAEAMAQLDPERWLVAFRRSSPRARSVLRQIGLSYVSAAGEIYVHVPPVHVEVPPARRTSPEAGARLAPAFSVRASRVPRWLLLHPEESSSVSQLSQELDLSPSVVSRAVRSLSDESFVRLVSDPHDQRRRRVELRRPSPLLEEFERAIVRRRIAQRTWDIGARDPESALDKLARLARRASLPHGIGGLAGAAMLKKVVEPVSVDVWIRHDDLELWTDELAATPGRPTPGAVTFRVLPDPFVLSLGWRCKGLWIADPVQLFLDCRQAGERAIDAAEAIRKEMRW